MATASWYILYAWLSNTFNIYLYISLALLILETLVLIINKRTCPLTPLAMKYTEDKKDNFDIYLPNKLAKYNKHIFWTIFVLGLALVIYNRIK